MYWFLEWEENQSTSRKTITGEINYENSLTWNVHTLALIFFGYKSHNGNALTACATCAYICIYNIAFVNSERWLAKSRVDITLCQHGKFPATLLLKFFVLDYKRNIKHFFCIDTQLYQHSWKLEKLEIVWKHSTLRASCFLTISRFSNFHSCWYNCISTRKMFYIS